MSRNKFHANGKLLLFGEYAILDGAKALAIPTKKGQSLQIKAHRGSDLLWESYGPKGELWFEAQLSLYDFSSIRTSDQKVSDYLQKLLKGAVRYNTEFLNKWNGFKAINRLEFDRDWGLGSSSTLVYNVAEWAEVSPFHLHFYVSSGSGYDVACAGAESPIIYQLSDDQLHYEEIDFEPSFLKNIYFVYLGKKQNTGEGIIHYTQNAKKRKDVADELTKITDAVLECNDFDSFTKLMDKHETILSAELQLPKVKEELFKKFPGGIKSLGAWGGDFVMAVSEESETKIKSYFEDAGYPICIPYHEMSF